jgi:hypothetical protein
MCAKIKFLAALLSLSWMSAWANADGTCSQCGCCECCKRCRLVCEMKEVTKTSYCCKCEDFCVLGKSKRCESSCGCGHCPDCRACAWIPTAAYVKTKHVAEKKETKVQKPTYHFVVEYVCPQCGCATPCCSNCGGGCGDPCCD